METKEKDKLKEEYQRELVIYYEKLEKWGKKYKMRPRRKTNYSKLLA
jgi:hypothetical protein